MAYIELPGWTIEPAAWLAFMAFASFALYDGIAGDSPLNAYNGAMGAIFLFLGSAYAGYRFNERFSIVEVRR